MGHGHSHTPVGDPEAAAWLWQLVERLDPASADAERAAAILRDAHAPLLRLVQDENPRTRVQARALLLVGDLVARGELDEAAELLTGEIRRSFQGRAELEPNEIELLAE